MLNKRYLSFRVIKVSTLCARITIYRITFVKIILVALNFIGSNTHSVENGNALSWCSVVTRYWRFANFMGRLSSRLSILSVSSKLQQKLSFI